MEPESARSVARQLARAVSAGANVMRDEDVDNLIGNAILTRIRETPVAPIIGKFLALLTADNRHQALLDQVIRLTAKGLTENQDLIRDRVDKETPWWVPGAVDDKITKRIVDALEKTMKDVNENPEHPIRLRFDTAIDEFIVKLQASPEVILKAERIKDEVLSADAVRQLSGAIWRDTKAALSRYADSPDEVNTEAIERGLRGIGQAIQSDPALRAKIDQWIVDAAIAVIERYQDEVGELIATDGEALGSDCNVPAHRAGDRSRPAVHPDQRHARRRTCRHAAVFVGWLVLITAAISERRRASSKRLAINDKRAASDQWSATSDRRFVR